MPRQANAANDIRHPNICPSAFPKGIPRTPATEPPAAVTAVAFPNCDGRTREAGYAATTDQKAPWATAPSIRAASSISNVVERAVVAFAAPMAANEPRTIAFRGIRRVTAVKGAAVSMTVKAKTVIKLPVSPGERSKVSAICGMRPPGKNSVDIEMKIAVESKSKPTNGRCSPLLSSLEWPFPWSAFSENVILIPHNSQI